MADDLTTTILSDYPSFAFLLNDAEIGPLLLDAVDPNKGFDAATFQAKLLQTAWWKTHSATARQWLTLVATDPATAQQQKDAWISQVGSLASQYGVHLGAEQLNNWADFYLSAGVQAADPRIVDSIVNLYYGSPGFRSGDSGSIESITNQARALADQYMINLTDSDYAYWGQRIARGDQTLQGLQDELKQLAMDRYGAYADRIQAGATPTQIFGQQRNAIAQQLEVDPSSIDLLNDPRWSQVLGVPDGKGGTRAMTYSESINLARSQPEWANTTVARQQGADLTTTIAQEFGALA